MDLDRKRERGTERHRQRLGKRGVKTEGGKERRTEMVEGSETDRQRERGTERHRQRLGEGEDRTEKGKEKKTETVED